jgi:3-hydroxyacyl-CoA dehydrogenase/enoyl-CoA hydratase/3-hydroxybutyryl-CoA epimerase
MTKFFRIEPQGEITAVYIDRSDKDMNILSEPVIRELDNIVEQLKDQASCKGVVFISGKDDHFIVGADIADIQNLKTEESATNGAKAMQGVFQKIHTLGKPTVAAIHGPCLGGGLELSLACTWRVASSDEKTKLGLPEIQLGFIPGAGGTQRLPRLVGIQSGLDMILTAKRVDGARSLKMGLVDACVHRSLLLSEAIRLAQTSRNTSHQKKSTSLTWALEGNPIGRRIMRQKATSTVLEKTKGFYPASTAALEAVFDGFETSLVKGLDIEARLFGKLVQTRESKSLVHLFHATTAIKKHPYKDAGEKRFGDKVISTVGIIGGGFMGGGIANVCADKGIRVFVSDPNKESLSRLLSTARSFFFKKVKAKRLKNFQAESKINHITPQLNPAGFERADVVVEAVFEDLALKQKILAGLESRAGQDWVFASNTSAIPISSIASASKIPEQILGMHFFSPVEKMPLLEIVVTDKTAPWATARAIDLGNRMGKTIIVVKDSPGFYTTRVLAIYLAEAALILGEGIAIDHIDKSLTDFGWPVGAINLIDEVGIDVGMHVMETMSKAWPERFLMPPQFVPIKESGRLGRKNAKGFYKYEEGKKVGVDDSIYSLLNLKPSTRLTPLEIVDRCVLAYVNESVRSLEEGIIPKAYEGDIGSVFGLGFPPIWGGPFKYIDLVGASLIEQKLLELEKKYGPRFAPSKLLASHAKQGKLFYPDEA